VHTQGSHVKSPSFGATGGGGQDQNSGSVVVSPAWLPPLHLVSIFDIFYEVETKWWFRLGEGDKRRAPE